MSIPYDASRKSLYEPGKSNNFFSIKHTPIQVFLQNEAALCAEMSRLAYFDNKNCLDDYLGLVGFNKVIAINYAKEGTQAFIAKKQDGDNELIVIAFRGTEKGDPSDLFTDANFLLEQWTDVSGNSLGNVHKGFAEALLKNKVWEQIQDYLELFKDKPVRVLITGHSLGAALATLTASRLIRLLLSAEIHLYTFGSPRVGDKDFARSLTHVDHARYVDCSDIVTRVPPEELGYVHVGTLRYIDREGHVLKTADDNTVADDRIKAATDYVCRYSFIPDTVWVREMADHSPINYVSGVTGLRP